MWIFTPVWNWHVCVMPERSFWCAWWREKPFLICVICVIAWNRKKYVRDCVKVEKCDQFVWLRESGEIRAWWRKNGEKFAWLRDWTPPGGPQWRSLVTKQRKNETTNTTVPCVSLWMIQVPHGWSAPGQGITIRNRLEINTNQVTV